MHKVAYIGMSYQGCLPFQAVANTKSEKAKEIAERTTKKVYEYFGE